MGLNNSFKAACAASHTSADCVVPTESKFMPQEPSPGTVLTQDYGIDAPKV